MKLKPSPWKHIFLLALSSAFFALGIHLVRENPIIGWLTIVFFGLGVVVFAISVVPGSSFLQLRDEGLTLRSLYRTWHVSWLDTSEFFVARVGGRQMVCWNYSPSFVGQRLGRAMSRGIAGVEAGLPDTYGRSATELAQLLNEWHMRYNANRPRM